MNLRRNRIVCIILSVIPAYFASVGVEKLTVSQPAFSVSIPGPPERTAIIEPDWLGPERRSVTPEAAPHWSRWLVVGSVVYDQEVNSLIENGALANEVVTTHINKRRTPSSRDTIDLRRIEFVDQTKQHRVGPWIIAYDRLDSRGFLADGRFVHITLIESASSVEARIQLIDPTQPAKLTELSFSVDDLLCDEYAHWQYHTETSNDLSTLAIAHSSEQGLVFSFVNVADGQLRKELAFPQLKGGTEWFLADPQASSSWTLSPSGDKVAISLAGWDRQRLIGERKIQIYSTHSGELLNEISDLGSAPLESKHLDDEDVYEDNYEDDEVSEEWWPTNIEFRVTKEGEPGLSFDAARREAVSAEEFDDAGVVEERSWTTETGPTRYVNIASNRLVQKSGGLTNNDLASDEEIQSWSLDGEYVFTSDTSTVRIRNRTTEVQFEESNKNFGGALGDVNPTFIPDTTSFVYRRESYDDAPFTALANQLGVKRPFRATKVTELFWYDWKNNQTFCFDKQRHQTLTTFCQPACVSVLCQQLRVNRWNDSQSTIEVWQLPLEPRGESWWPLVIGCLVMTIVYWLFRRPKKSILPNGISK